MLTSLYSGLSGLDANGTALSVVGNNIANINTPGFKASEVAFEDVLGATLAGEEVGQGVSVGSITPVFTQGVFENTSSVTDLAINGNGFFVVSDGDNKLYTRAGRFIFDAQGTLTNPQGMAVQGWLADETGTIKTTGETSNITLGTTVFPGKASEAFNIHMNLDAEAKDKESFATSLELFDSKGGRVTLTVEVTYDATAKQWNWTASSPDGKTTDKGSFTFDQTGKLTGLTEDPTITITDMSDGAASLNLSWDVLDDAGESNGSVTSLASLSVVNSQTQDGYGVGSLQRVSVDSSGVITGFFSNGQHRDLAEVALADFRSPWGLLTLGEGLYAASPASGEAAIGAAKSGARGSISAGALELSNVDLAREFVKMISAQRGFQASSRVISITDEILNDVINLKR